MRLLRVGLCGSMCSSSDGAYRRTGRDWAARWVRLERWSSPLGVLRDVEALEREAACGKGW
jgi:hypothetical protein